MARGTRQSFEKYPDMTESVSRLLRFLVAGLAWMFRVVAYAGRPLLFAGEAGSHASSALG